MTDATQFGWAYVPADTPKEPVARPAPPAPQPFAAPVFIHDCVTPLGGETVLSLLMRRMMKDDQP